MKNKQSNVLFTVGVVLLVMTALIGLLFVNGNVNDEGAANAITRGNEQTVYNMLLLGKDSAAGLCDVMILVSIDTGSGNVAIIQIPRDTYFNYTDGSYKKINGAPSALGSEQFASKLGNALGTKIDYYLCVDYDVVEQMVDMLSGVEIDVPMDMSYSDPAQNLTINLGAGKQMLNGRECIQFLRYRSGYVTGDLGRIDAQKLFLNAFVKRMCEKKNPSVFINLYNIIKNKGSTNIREQDLIMIGLKCAKTKGGEVSYLTAPGEAIQSSQSGAWYYVLSKESMVEILSKHLGMPDARENFDKEEKFVDKNIKSFYDIYNKRCEYKIYSADDIENNEININ